MFGEVTRRRAPKALALNPAVPGRYIKVMAHAGRPFGDSGGTRAMTRASTGR